MRKDKLGNFLSIFLLIAVGCQFLFGVARAARVDELQAKIEEQENEIGNIEQEIVEYEKKVEQTQEEANTLKAEVTRIDSGIQRINYNIRLTKKKVESSALSIEKLSLEITDKEKDMEDRKVYLGEIIRNINEADATTLVELMLSQGSFSDFFNDIKWSGDFQNKINSSLEELRNLKQNLGEEQDKEREEKRKSENLKSELTDQKNLEEIGRNNKNNLLEQTKNKESNYKKILEEKKKLKEDFERELREIELQLKATVDPSSLPAKGSKVLDWPLSAVYITQYFGNTKFAQSGAYNGSGHNGIDFRAKSPKKVFVVADGIVEGTGNTDEIIIGSKIRVTFSRVNVRKEPNGSILGSQSRGRTGTIISGPIEKGKYKWWKVNFSRGNDGWVADVAISNMCYSFGKWVLIKHNSGLATIYAHLSLVKTQKGQVVNRGNIIGYTGNTGYSTGPHLHLTVYAAQDVQIKKFDHSINCKNAYVPIAPLSAYLNPMDYLPEY